MQLTDLLHSIKSGPWPLSVTHFLGTSMNIKELTCCIPADDKQLLHPRHPSNHHRQFPRFCWPRLPPVPPWTGPRSPDVSNRDHLRRQCAWYDSACVLKTDPFRPNITPTMKQTRTTNISDSRSSYSNITQNKRSHYFKYSTSASLQSTLPLHSHPF